MELQLAMHTLTSSTRAAGYNRTSIMWHDILFQVESCEDDLANDHSKRVGQDVLLLLVRCIRGRRHNQPEDIQVREVERFRGFKDSTNTG